MPRTRGGATVPARPARRWFHLRYSVRVRITLAAVGVTAAAVGIAGWLLVRSVEDTQLNQLRDDVTAQVDEVVARLEAGEDPEAAVLGASSFLPVQVLDDQGRRLASAPAFLGNEDDSEPPDGATRDVSVGRAPPGGPEGAGVDAPEGAGAFVSEDYAFAGPIEEISQPVETPSGTLTVIAAAPVEPVARSVDALRGALVVGLPALVVLVAAVTWVLVGRALRPVEAIRAEVDEITGTTMHRRVPEPPTGDEIGRLARTMNAMLSRLDGTATRQRQFVSDASHELRSPVAAIRTRLEVARRHPGRADWPAVADAALAEETRLEALLDDLLLLAAQDENGAATPKRAPVDLAAVTIAEAQRPRRVPVHVTPSSDGSNGNGSNGNGALVVPGAADQLARVVGNLLDNAARYATTAVRTSVAMHDEVVRVTVDDDGLGIPARDRGRVFERFTRLDDSRTRDGGGTGLGLAVVRSIVTRHYGQVWADESPDGGARFVAELPATSHPASPYRDVAQVR